MKLTGSANELSHKEEQEQIAYYGGKNEKTMEELLAQTFNHREHTFKKPIIVVGLDYDAYNHPKEEADIDFIIETEADEKATLYTAADEDSPFWCEVMVLAVETKNGDTRKFYFNGEYYHLELDVEHYPKAKSEYRRLKKQYEKDGYELHLILSN